MDDSGRGRWFNRLFKRRKDDSVEDEIVTMLNEGQEAGDILESEAEMITNILGLNDKSASEIMTHRKNIQAIEASQTLKDALRIISEENFSRFPVYKDDIDHITGILHIKDALKYFIDGSWNDTPICEIDGLVSKANFIPETSKIDGIFKKMQDRNTHLAIVVDEYGQTAGLVAMEDIIEEIVGNIFDEHDEVEYDIIKESDNVYVVNALTSLSDIESETGIDLYDEDNDTLNGFLVSVLGRLPEDDVGREIEKDGVKYKILTVEDKTIGKVRMEITEEATVEDD